MSNITDRCVCFVISAARSGSTWLKEALNAHPEIYCTEHRFFGMHYDVVPTADGETALRCTLDRFAALWPEFYDFRAIGMQKPAFQQELLARLVRAALDLSFERSGKRIVVDKLTPYRGTADTVLRQVLGTLPEAMLVQLVRDGRDVCTSGVFDWLQRARRDHPRYAVFVEKRTGLVIDRFFDDADIVSWAEQWVGPIRAFAVHAPEAPRIAYEDMKRNQAAVLDKLFKILKVEAGMACVSACVDAASFERMSGGRAAGQGEATAKARKGIAGDWQQYFTRRDGELFHEIAGHELIALGYAESAAWVDALPERLDLRAEGMA